MSARVHDLAVIGGGINGCGIARDAQGRGLDVFLAEAGDLSGATSSASTKLIHGGLRYLEFYEFRLVREALREREVLLGIAPHIIRPLRFVLPHHGGLRPWPVIRLGLFLYDHIGGRRTLPPTRSLDLRADPAGRPLKSGYARAFAYSDCRVDDARLVILNARDAADRGATIAPRTRCVSGRREGGLWHLVVEDGHDGSRRAVVARALVNAAGPWVSDVLHGALGAASPVPTRLVKGSHLVVEKLFDHDRAYIFQNADGRICFAIPYEDDFTLVGTTDEDFHGDPATVAISAAETDYLLGAVSEYFATPVTRDRIRWTFAGVRPLYDDGAARAQAATRDYVLTLDSPGGAAPLLSIFGGKITTYRRLAEAALDRLAGAFPGMRPAWTAGAPLPGGDVGPSFASFVAAKLAQYGFLEAAMVRRLCHAYGTRIDVLLAGVAADDDLGADFGAGLRAREVDYLCANEWAETTDDILWRRSKLGLHLDADGKDALAAYLAERGKGRDRG